MNIIVKKAATKAVKLYKQHMASKGWFNQENFKDKIPTRPSCSIMHSLSLVFFIFMYSSKRRVNLDTLNHRMHQLNRVRLQILPWMCVIWHESLYHSEAKSRNNPDPLLDMHFLSYFWPCIKNNWRNKKVGKIDVLAREQGDLVYRHGIHYHLWEDFYDQYPKCTNCKEK